MAQSGGVPPLKPFAFVTASSNDFLLSLAASVALLSRVDSRGGLLVLGLGRMRDDMKLSLKISASGRQRPRTRRDDLRLNTRQDYVGQFCAHNQKTTHLPEDPWCVQALSCCCACMYFSITDLVTEETRCQYPCSYLLYRQLLH